MSDWMYYRLKSPKPGYTRYLRYGTHGYFACPDATDKDDLGSKHSWSAKSGSLRKEVVDETRTTVVDPDGSKVVTVTTVVRQWKVSKAGRKPMCRCGKAMEWKGWWVSLTDQKDKAAYPIVGFRDATDDIKLWTKYAKTLKQRQRIIETALNDQ